MPDQINDREFSVVLPKFDNSKNKIEPQVIENIIKRISNRFGGSTSVTQNIGCFVPEDQRPDVDQNEAEMLQEELGNIQCEEVLQVKALRDSSENVSLESDRQFIEDLASNVADELGQFSITVNEDKTEFQFVEPDNSFRGSLDSDKLEERDIFDRLI